MEEITAKTFDELTTDELYRVLQARAEVFVVEQRCAYQDIDGVDRESVHLYTEEDGRITSYLRYFEKPGESGTFQIGRVLTTKRGEGLGGKLLHAATERLRATGADRIYLEAQVYARGFYEKEGFTAVTGEFLEDGIPHIGMELILTK